MNSDAEPSVFSQLTFTSSDLATVLAGFGGAILGGGLSWLLARQTAKETRKRDEEARNSHDKAALLQTALKVMQVSNGIYTIHRNIEGSIENAQAQGVKPSALWTLVRPVAGRTDSPKFDASDFVPFAVSGRADLINRIIIISDRYEAIESAFREYSQRRLSFQELVAPYTTLGPAGGQHTTTLPEEMISQATLRGYELEQLITQIRDFVNNDLDESKSLCSDVDAFAKDYLKGKGGFVSLELGDPNERSAAAAKP